MRVNRRAAAGNGSMIDRVVVENYIAFLSFAGARKPFVVLQEIVQFTCKANVVSMTIGISVGPN